MTKLSNGRTIHENIIGLSEESKTSFALIYGGYDSAVTTLIDDAYLRDMEPGEELPVGTEIWLDGIDSFGPPHTRVVQPEERKELAMIMMERWRKWGGLSTRFVAGVYL